MNKYALVNEENIVTNVVLWDGVSEWKPPANTKLVSADNVRCNSGWFYDGTNFIDPNPPVIEPEPTTEQPTT